MSDGPVAHEPTRRPDDPPSLVRWTVEGHVLVVTIDHPPVNALSHAVREGLMQAAEKLDAEAALQAMVIRSTGSVFIGGADIREFNGPRRDPLLHVVCHRLEACTKPVVAAVQGAALGGGFEVALASHYRVASPTAEVAFPEVLLGLLPGAGGTQRAPRLCGAALALDLMLTGRRLSASSALAAGLLDRLADDPSTEAVAWATALGASAAGPRRSREGRALVPHADQTATVDEARDRVHRDLAHLVAPAQIVACVDAAIHRPFDDGSAVEAAAFLTCLASPQRAALVHLFFAERAVRGSVATGVDLSALGAQLQSTLPATAPVWDDATCNAMAAVGDALLASGMAQAPTDIDVASVRHAGFPRHRGGILFDRSRRMHDA